MEPGVIHGICNGHLSDVWSKTETSKYRIEQYITKHDNSFYSSIDSARVLSSNLMEIMRDPTPLKDPTTGFSDEVYAKVSAIFVSPVIRPDLLELFRTRTTTTAVLFKDSEDAYHFLVTENDISEEMIWSEKETVLNII